MDKVKKYSTKKVKDIEIEQIKINKFIYSDEYTINNNYADNLIKQLHFFNNYFKPYIAKLEKTRTFNYSLLNLIDNLITIITIINLVKKNKINKISILRYFANIIYFYLEIILLLSIIFYKGNKYNEFIISIELCNLLNKMDKYLFVKPKKPNESNETNKYKIILNIDETKDIEISDIDKYIMLNYTPIIYKNFILNKYININELFDYIYAEILHIVEPMSIIMKYITNDFINSNKEKNESNYKKTTNKITVIYDGKKYTRIIYINENKNYVKINKTYMLLSRLKQI
jgi:hypothetical protein